MSKKNQTHPTFILVPTSLISHPVSVEAMNLSGSIKSGRGLTLFLSRSSLHPFVRPALNLCLSPHSGARLLGVPLPPTTPRRAPALAHLSPAQIPPAPWHSVFPAHPARPRSPALAASASAPPSPRRLLSANKKLAHICALSLLHARVLVLCACECKFECECDCAWKNVRPTVP